MATGDRNYDIAKETTSQEILSAMSNSHLNREMKFDYQTKLSGETQVLSLNGKGRLYNCWFKDILSGTGNSVKLQITIDGKTIANIENVATDSSNSRTKSIIIGSFDWVKYKQDNNMMLISSNELISTSAYTKFVGLSEDLQTQSHGSDANVWVLVEDYVSFNESLVIKATTSGSNGIFSAIYSLDK